jgi:hypothetical protein
MAPYTHDTYAMEQQHPTKRAPELATDTTLPTEWIDRTSNFSELQFQDPPGTRKFSSQDIFNIHKKQIT